MRDSVGVLAKIATAAKSTMIPSSSILMFCARIAGMKCVSHTRCHGTVDYPVNSTTVSENMATLIISKPRIISEGIPNLAQGRIVV